LGRLALVWVREVREQEQENCWCGCGLYPFLIMQGSSICNNTTLSFLGFWEQASSSCRLEPHDGLRRGSLEFISPGPRVAVGHCTRTEQGLLSSRTNKQDALNLFIRVF
jgi:hypothetical protein